MIRSAKLATVALAAAATVSSGAIATAPAHADALSRTTSTSSAATGPIVGLRQAGTGYDQWYNCGPTSMVMAMLRIHVTPKGYVSPTNYSTAVANMRRAMTPSTRHVDKQGNVHYGSAPADAVEGLRAYGKSGSITHVTQAMTAARSGKAAIVWGNEAASGWKGLWSMNLKAGTTYAGHIVALVGYSSSTGKYRVLDPLSTASSNYSHWVTAKQLNIYSNGAGTGATNVVIN